MNVLDLEGKASNERMNFENALKAFEQDFKSLDNGANMSVSTLKQDFETLKQALEDLGAKLF